MLDYQYFGPPKRFYRVLRWLGSTSAEVLAFYLGWHLLDLLVGLFR